MTVEELVQKLDAAKAAQDRYVRGVEAARTSTRDFVEAAKCYIETIRRRREIADALIRRSLKAINHANSVLNRRC